MRLNILSEAYPQVSFRYDNYQHDPKPDVLVLGSYLNNSTGKKLLAGINLNYLSNEQLLRLGDSIEDIYSSTSLPSRYDAVKAIGLEDYFRTYDSKHISVINKKQFADRINQISSIDTDGDIPKPARHKPLPSRPAKPQPTQPGYTEKPSPVQQQRFDRHRAAQAARTQEKAKERQRKAASLALQKRKDSLNKLRRNNRYSYKS